MNKKTSFKYGTPVDATQVSSRRRLPQYDECLREFLQSENKYWKVNSEALPSKNTRVILSSLKWRVKNKTEFKKIQVSMNNKEVYLERVDEDEQ